jgi:hypothetical protein
MIESPCTPHNHPFDVTSSQQQPRSLQRSLRKPCSRPPRSLRIRHPTSAPRLSLSDDEITTSSWSDLFFSSIRATTSDNTPTFQPELVVPPDDHHDEITPWSQIFSSNHATSDNTPTFQPELVVPPDDHAITSWSDLFLSIHDTSDKNPTFAFEDWSNPTNPHANCISPPTDIATINKTESSPTHSHRPSGHRTTHQTPSHPTTYLTTYPTTHLTTHLTTHRITHTSTHSTIHPSTNDPSTNGQTGLTTYLTTHPNPTTTVPLPRNMPTPCHHLMSLVFRALNGFLSFPTPPPDRPRSIHSWLSYYSIY